MPLDTIERWLKIAAENRGSERFLISLAAFNAIVSGRHLSISEVAAMNEVGLQRTRQLVAEMVSEGRLTIDETGNVITGAGGLSLVESRHVLDMNSRRFWVWCALDAVGIPAGLEADATVISSVVDTCETVRIEMTAGVPAEFSPPDLFVSLVEPTLSASLHDCCCSEISFYSSPNAVPTGSEPITVEQAVLLGRQLWQDGIPL